MKGIRGGGDDGTISSRYRWWTVNGGRLVEYSWLKLGPVTIAKYKWFDRSRVSVCVHNRREFVVLGGA